MEKNNMKLQFDTITASKNIISHIDTDGCDEEFVKATATIVKDFTKKLQELANTNKEENKKKETKKRWKPNIGENYFRICSYNNVTLLKWEDGVFDNRYYNARDIYKTREEAEFELERRKIMIELQNVADEYNGKFTDEKYWIAYDSDEDYLWVDSSDLGYPLGVILFSSENAAHKAIDIVGKDKIRKYVLGLADKIDSCKSESINCNHDCEDCDYYAHWDDDEEDEY